jgi:hypothetical protein
LKAGRGKTRPRTLLAGIVNALLRAGAFDSKKLPDKSHGTVTGLLLKQLLSKTASTVAAIVAVSLPGIAAGNEIGGM